MTAVLFRRGALAIVLPLALGAPAGAWAERLVLPSDVVPDHYQIAITPDASALTFTGRVKIDLTVRQPTRRIVLNNADIVIDRASPPGDPAPTEVERSELYGLLGRAEDPVLARRALDLSVSALDFLSAHWVKLSALLEPDSRSQYAADLAGEGF